MREPAAVWILLLFLAGCSHGPRGESRGTVDVEAEGWSTYDARDPGASFQRALANAQTNVVAKALGFELSAETTVKQAVTVSETIEARTRGTVLRYETLSQRISAGAVGIRIRAVVQLEAGPRRSALKVVVSASFNDARLQQLVSNRFPASSGPARRPDATVTGTVLLSFVNDPRLGGMRSFRAHTVFDVEVRGQRSRHVRDSFGLDSDPELACQLALERAAEDVISAVRSELEVLPSRLAGR